MKPRISVLALSVSDLEKAAAFYRDGLGFKTEGIVGREFEHGAVGFFELDHGLRPALWPRTSLAADTGLPDGPRGEIAFTQGHNVASAAEVDEVMNQAAKAGAKIVKLAQVTFWGGYAGYFQDPDGHIWEVVFDPAFV
ncbi:MAG: VOC family protein [Burkholderiaceae bacterium]|nr:VOC family protein [Burkholderiaceae bacterium]